MIDERDLLERAAKRFAPEPGMVERVYRRRDRKRRNRRIGTAVLALIVAAMGLGAVIRVFHAAERQVPAAPTSSPYRITLSRIALGRTNVAASWFDGTTLWVCTSPPGGGMGYVYTMLAFDPATGEPTGLPLKLQSCGSEHSVVADGDLWSASSACGTHCHESGISRIDLQTGRTTTLPILAYPVAFWDGSVWAMGRSGLLRIDPITGSLQAVVYDQPFRDPELLAFAQGDVWFTHGGPNNRMYRIDLATDQVIATIPVGRYINGMASSDSAVWVAGSDGTLLRIDPATNEIGGQVHIGRNLFDVTVAYGRVWTIVEQVIARNSVELLTQVDPGSMRVLGQGVTFLPSPDTSFRIVAAGGSLWAGDEGPGCGGWGIGLVRIGLQPGGRQGGIAGRNPPWLRPGYKPERMPC